MLRQITSQLEFKFEKNIYNLFPAVKYRLMCNSFIRKKWSSKYFFLLSKLKQECLRKNWMKAVGIKKVVSELT